MICPTCKGGRTLLKKVRGKGCYEVVLDVCDQCNGTGEIKATNFQRITASPEKLAEFIDEHYGVCPRSCGHCFIGKDFCFAKNRLDEPIGKAFVDWLKEESEMREVSRDQKENEKETEKGTEETEVVQEKMGQ